MEEIWKDIKGYESLYQVSNLGNIKSLTRKTNTSLLNQKYVLKKGKLIKKNVIKNYLVVSLSKNNIVKIMQVHRLVAQAFIPNPLDKPQVNHIDGNKQNNCVNNLEWVSAKENHKHACEHNLITKEQMQKCVKAMSKQNQKSILQIKNGLVMGCFESLTKAQERTGIKIKNISSVLNGRSKTAGGYEWKIKGEI